MAQHRLPVLAWTRDRGKGSQGRQSVYPLARKMGVEIKLPSISPQPYTHLAFEGYQYAKEHGLANEYNDRVLRAFF